MAMTGFSNLRQPPNLFVFFVVPSEMCSTTRSVTSATAIKVLLSLRVLPLRDLVAQASGQFILLTGDGRGELLVEAGLE